jgi:hypothetical protein
MKQFTINEIKEIQKEQNYKYIGLFDNNGIKVIPYNSNSSTAGDRLKEVEIRLNSAGLQEGYYNISCKNTLKGGSADNYLIKKGDNEVLQVEKKPVEIIAPDLLSYGAALKLNVEVASLKLENAALKKEINLLNEQLKENETFLSEMEPAEAAPSMIESAKNFLSEAMGFIAPMLDKHFELKEKALNLQELKLNQVQNLRPQQNQQKTENDPEKNKKLENWIKTFSDQKEIYEELAKIYNNAQSVDEFLRELQNYNSDLLKELTEWKKS